MGVLDVTDAKGRWRLTDGQVENRKTGQIRLVTGIRFSDVACDHEEVFARKCQTAYDTGQWPVGSDCRQAGLSR